MAVCPHCRKELDNSKQYITCPHCGRTTTSVDNCVKAILSSGQLEGLLQKASNEYWEIITTGLRHIVIMDMETCLEVRDRLFKLLEESPPHTNE